MIWRAVFRVRLKYNVWYTSFFQLTANQNTHRWLNITYHDNGTITVSITIDLQGSLIEMENTILDATNEIGCLATGGGALKRFDSNGSPIIREGVKWTAKGQDAKKYQTPYGVAEIERYVYQTSQGGRI